MYKPKNKQIAKEVEVTTKARPHGIPSFVLLPPDDNNTICMGSLGCYKSFPVVAYKRPHQTTIQPPTSQGERDSKLGYKFFVLPYMHFHTWPYIRDMTYLLSFISVFPWNREPMPTMMQASKAVQENIIQLLGLRGNEMKSNVLKSGKSNG